MTITENGLGFYPRTQYISKSTVETDQQPREEWDDWRLSNSVFIRCLILCGLITIFI